MTRDVLRMEDQRDALDEALGGLGTALEALNGETDYADVRGALEGYAEHLREGLEEIEAELSAVYSREAEEMEREYWRAVI